MEFRVLGPIELVGDHGQKLHLPGGKPRVLLALLLLDAGRVVSTDRLVHGLWGERAPATAPKVLQGYVSRLRKLLPPGMLESREPGYLLHVDEDQLDLSRFERLRADAAVEAAAGRWQATAGLLAAALELWRGPPLADVAEELELPGEIARLDEMRLATLEERVAADLELGDESQLVPELELLATEHPLRERFRFQLMLALYRLGRQADALAVYRETRELLVEELGIEPGADLQRLERQILVQDETLAAVSRLERLPPLPAALTPLVGRTEELKEIGGLLNRGGMRLLTLVGPGGVGKTRLALGIAEPRANALYVPLAPVQEPGLVRSVIARTLGLTDEETLVEWLRPRELLLVIDNFEHLLDAAPLVTELLSAAPGLQVLATSREPLNLSGENRYTVAPLPEHHAIRLFVERAAAAEADVEGAPELEEICRRLDCLPLAIELAAARAKTLPPELMLARLGQRLPLLTGGPRDLPERQRTLRATIEWSYALLERSEQLALARLAVFAGGCTLEAAEEVCEASLETLESAVDKSFLVRGRDRFTMLETIREYARERLDASGETDLIAHRLAERLCALAETFSSERRLGLTAPLSMLESELENIRVSIRAALRWTDDPLALRLTAALAWYWRTSARQAEGLRWVVEALEQADDVPVAARADSLHAAAVLATLASDAERGRSYGEEALALHRTSGDDRRVAELLPWVAHAYLQAGDPTLARALHAESIAFQERVGDPVLSARAHRHAGEDELGMGDRARAIELFEGALRVARAAGATSEVVMTLHGLGDVFLVRGDAAGAARFYLDALDAGADETQAANCLAGLAAVAALEQDATTAGRLWGALESHQERHGDLLVHAATVIRYETALLEVNGAVFSSAVAAGHELSLEAATSEAIAAFEPMRE